jgi:hypothetical protein
MYLAEASDGAVVGTETERSMAAMPTGPRD